MRITRNALLRGCLLACVPIASMAQAPTIVEAESGSLGASLTTGTDATAGVNYITVLPGRGQLRVVRTHPRRAHWRR
jgi:hypothetical protein